jgi:hypothetical protein
LNSKIVFELDDGSTPSAVTIIDQSAATTIDPTKGPFLLYPSPARLVTCAPPDGYWDVAIDTRHMPNALSVVFKRIALAHGTSWWHSLHGLAGAKGPNKLRIGIIDEALEPQRITSCIRHITNLGGAAWGVPKSPRALTPRTDHGQAVCSLLSSRATSATGFPGAAPHDEIFFAAAGREKESVLEMDRVVACIDTLVDQYQCDILSISAGDCDKPLVALEIQVEEAADKGTLCFFAAGNERKTLYPAKYPLCLAVAALGKYGSAPSDTLIALNNHVLAEPLNGDFFLWKKSARGPEIEFCAPGIGVVWNRDGRAARGVSGTSYACPIAAGVAARILGNDPKFVGMVRSRARYDYGIKVLASSCQPFGVANEGNLWKHGLLWVP